MRQQTIFALATARGRAGVAVIRLSGPDVGLACERLCGKPLPEPRKTALVRLSDYQGLMIDHALIVYFQAPASFTGEDVLEFHLHGSPVIVERMMAELSRLENFRVAEAGEFTRRAFENGKMDLTEAEGLADLINAETGAQAQQALRQMRGALGEIYEGWRSTLIHSLAHLEADIDFPDEDLPEGVAGQILPRIEALIAELSDHLADDHRGERLRDGLFVVILGAPNVGKSSLLNLLAGRDAAIVSAQAGTTRDIIEVHLDLAGYPVTIADTAGLRETTDEIEAEGVRRARRRAEESDLAIVMQVSSQFQEGPFGFTVEGPEDRLVLINKIDMEPEGSFAGSHDSVFAVSVKTGEGIERFLAALEKKVIERLENTGAPSLTRARHRQALEDCLAALKRFSLAPDPELAAEDIRLAARALGRITGRVDVEDVLDIVFGDFCIGK